MSDKQAELEALERFINALDRLNTLDILQQRGEIKLHKSAIEILGQLPERGDFSTAVIAINNHVKNLKVRPGRKSRKTYFMDTPQFDVALRWQSGAIKTKKAACEELCQLVATDPDPYDEPTAAKHLDDMKPRARAFLAMTKKMGF